MVFNGKVSSWKFRVFLLLFLRFRWSCYFLFFEGSFESLVVYRRKFRDVRFFLGRLRRGYSAVGFSWRFRYTGLDFCFSGVVVVCFLFLKVGERVEERVRCRRSYFLGLSLRLVAAWRVFFYID